jgi:hypothetical protein
MRMVSWAPSDECFISLRRYQSFGMIPLATQGTHCRSGCGFTVFSMASLPHTVGGHSSGLRIKSDPRTRNKCCWPRSLHIAWNDDRFWSIRGSTRTCNSVWLRLDRFMCRGLVLFLAARKTKSVYSQKKDCLFVSKTVPRSRRTSFWQ